MIFFNTEPKMRRHVGWLGRAEELRVKGVIETAPVGLLVINDVGEVLVANQSALELFGVEQSEDLVGKALETCVAVEDSKALAGFVDRVCGGESGSLECQLVGNDGLRHLVEIRAVPLRRKEGRQRCKETHRHTSPTRSWTRWVSRHLSARSCESRQSRSHVSRRRRRACRR